MKINFTEIIKVAFPILLISGSFFVVLLVTLLLTPKDAKDAKGAEDVKYAKDAKDGNIKLLHHTRSKSGDKSVHKFISLETGIHYIFSKSDGPMVEGDFIFATETQDNDGLPHSLEHMVFLGSDDYPYEGTLDLLAYRSLAEGLDAWTEIDYTDFTLKTVGKEGFLKILPIYIDHLLYPTLTDTGFTTEVHDINGEGQDGGVVYSEMQSNENSGSDRTYNQLIRLLYPEPSGYYYETGGLLANLRNSTNIEKIRKYHKTMYRPENLYIIITGLIDKEEIFKAMEPIESKILSEGKRCPFVKPWRTPPPSLFASREMDVLFPSDNEDTGFIQVGWRGPSLAQNLAEFQSMEVLLEYLTELSSSHLAKVFVEVEDPLASYVSGYMLEYSVSSAIFEFGGVPVSKLDKVKPLLIETLIQIVIGEIPFDEEAMEYTLDDLETSPYDTLTDDIILDVLYGENNQFLGKLIDKHDWYDHLRNETPSYWYYLINKYFLAAPYAFTKGIPSIAEANRIQEEERLRVEQRIKTLGEKELRKLEETLVEAEVTNLIEPPKSMLESIPIQSITHINFNPHKAYTNMKMHSSGFIPKSDPSLLNLDDVPVKMQLSDVNSDSVQLIGILDTHSLSPNERMYLPLLMELLLESPIQNGSSVIPHDEVIKQLYGDTITAEKVYGLDLTSSSDFEYGSYFHNVMINLEVEMDNYEKGVEWMSNILFRVFFTSEKILVKANKLFNSIGEEKRDGFTITTHMSNDVIFKQNTNINKGSPLRQEIFLNQVIRKVRSNPTNILEEIRKIYKKITDLDNITILMASSLQSLSNSTNATIPWLTFVPNGGKSHNMTFNVIADADERIPFNYNSNLIGYIAGIKSIESSYLLQSTMSISNFYDPDLPALKTAISYFTQFGGPMWKQIRGKGLAYDFSVKIEANSGTLSFRLSEAAQLIGAYKEALKIFNSYLNGSEQWNRLLFESARSSLVYEIVNRETDSSDVIQEALYAYYRKVNHDYNKYFLRAIDEVTLEDVKRVYKRYFKSLIDPKLSKTVIVCPSAKATQYRSDLAKLGQTMDIINSLEKSRFAKL